MKRILWSLALLLGAILIAALAFPGRIDPAVFHPSLSPELVGPLAANKELERIELLGRGLFAGPEDVEPDGEGRIYSGNEDGTIRRLMLGDGGGTAEIFADTGGRPLGLDLDGQGTLWVADGTRGLLSIGSTGSATVRVDTVDGARVGFADDVDTGPDGRVYFSDASTRFSLDELNLEPLEARPWGRLVELDPESGRVRMLLDDLYFANGVAVSADGSFVLVAETFRYRIRRYWLRGPRTGEDEVFVDNLPGFPDGVSRNGQGGFWVALFSPRVDLLDQVLHPRPWLKKLIGRLPAVFHPRPKAYGFIVALDARGEVVASLHDPTGMHYPYITSVEERDGFLYLGSIDADSIARYRLR